MTSRSMGRRRAVLGTAAALAAPGLTALAAACAPGPALGPAPGQEGSPRTFRIAYLTLGWAGIELIHQVGLLEQRGWRIEWQAVDSISAVVNAFGAGQLDLIDMSAVIAAQMYEQGVRLAVFGLGVGALGAVLVGKDSAIRSVPELRGRTVAGIPGSTTSQALNASIRRIHGLDLFTETRFVPGTAPPDVANLLAKGDVEAALIWEPVTTQLDPLRRRGRPRHPAAALGAGLRRPGDRGARGLRGDAPGGPGVPGPAAGRQRRPGPGGRPVEAG